MKATDKKMEERAAAKIVATGNKHKSYGNDPFFVQKAAASKKVIEKYGLPKQFLSCALGHPANFEG